MITEFCYEALSDEIITAIKGAKKKSKEASLSISETQRRGHIYIADEVSHIILPEEVIYALNFINWDEVELCEKTIKYVPWFKKLPAKNVTMKELIRLSGGLSRCISRLQTSEKFLKYYMFSITHLSDSMQRSVYSYIFALLDGLQLIKGVTNDKKQRRTPKNPVDFCVLCWRRVRHGKFKKNIRGIKRRDSSFYCPKHHPNKETGAYNKARGTLLRAVKDEKKQFKYDIDKYELNLTSNARNPLLLNKWLLSFVSASPLSRKSDLKVKDWGATIEVLMLEAEKHFPYVYSVIKEQSKPKASSWANWMFNHVLDPLGGGLGNEERMYWHNENTTEWATLDNDAWLTILHVFRRYEAYHYIINRNRPRGPQKALNKPETPLKKQVRLLLHKALNENRTVDIKVIAKQANTSLKTVYEVKKTMKL